MSDEARPVGVPRILGFASFGAVLMGSYSIAKPAAESYFLAHHQSQSLPKAWLAVSFAVIVVVSIYGRIAATASLPRLFQGALFFSAAILLALLLADYYAMPGSAFLLYVWKDVYIVVLIEIFWSYANLVFEIKTARWLYGVFLGAGSLGSVLGNLAASWVASEYGTIHALWMVLPMLLLLLAASLRLSHRVAAPSPEATTKPRFGAGLSLVFSSRYLTLILLLVITVQLLINLVDYQYLAILEQTYPSVDRRTAVNGDVHAIINAGALALQFLCGGILRVIGVPSTLVLIPGIIGGSIIFFLLVPGFLSMSIAKVSGKVFDYSLFRAAKEILYIPLDYAEKTQGKAVIDMMVYRLAKGGAAFLLLGLTAVDAYTGLGFLNLSLTVVWLGITLALVPRFRKLTS
jgi:ATP/ADP translocase